MKIKEIESIVPDAQRRILKMRERFHDSAESQGKDDISSPAEKGN